MPAAASPVQFANADDPTAVTLSGIFTASKLLHPLNAELPIICSVDGNKTPVIEVFPKKALSPIAVIPSGIAM